MLIWPALALLKSQYPECKITALVPSYTRPIAELCPWIDKIITDQRHPFSPIDIYRLASSIRSGGYDASISLYSEFRTAIAVWISRIPERYGPATKLAQLFLNRTMIQRRSRSLKPEYEYNIDLTRHYISISGDIPTTTPAPPYLAFPASEIEALKNSYRLQHNIASDKLIIIVHPGTGGSAINLSINQFSEIAHKITYTKAHFIVSAGPEELDTAKDLLKLLSDLDCSLYHSESGLVSFAKFIDIGDLFISGSTGPLHIAGALNIPTTAFYSARRSATALRWQTLNEEGRRLSFSPTKHTGEDDMLTIDTEKCANKITSFLDELYAYRSVKI